MHVMKTISPPDSCTTYQSHIAPSHTVAYVLHPSTAISLSLSLCLCLCLILLILVVSE